jgi:TPP-dependent pyruvate/acetoin dehydrogenase alpha subunit
MTLARLLDADQAFQPIAQPFGLPLGNLAPVVAGALDALSRSDWWVPGPRERIGAVLRDVPMERLVPMGRGARPYRVAPGSASAGIRALTAVGLAVASPDDTVLVHLGAGALADGALHEALNLASMLRPNVIFLVAADPLSDGAPLGPQVATSHLEVLDRWAMPLTTLQTPSPEEVADAVRTAKQASGPAIVLATL